MVTMKKTFVMMLCIALFLSSYIVTNAQIFSKIIHLNGDLLKDNPTIFPPMG
jgi:hypothetical protein